MNRKFISIILVMLFFAFTANAQKQVSLTQAPVKKTNRLQVVKKADRVNVVAKAGINHQDGIKDLKGCEHELIMNDSYGDGWDGNVITVSVNSTVVLDQVTLGSGYTGSEFFTCEAGDQIDVEYELTGIHYGENSWILNDGNGITLITGSEMTATWTQTTTAGTCPAGNNVGITSVTPTFVMSGNSATPMVTITNMGGVTETAFDVEVTIGGDYSSIVNVTAITLDPGDDYVVTMDEWMTPADGTYTINAEVTIAVDDDLSNNIVDVTCQVAGFADAYGGCTTVNTYNEVTIVDGALTPVGAIASDPFPMAEEFADGVMYRTLNGGGFGTVSPDGTYTSLGATSGFAGTLSGLAYDWDNDIMYAMVLDGSNLANICTLDLGTLVLTQVGSAGTAMIIAIDMADDGYIYGPDLTTDALYQYDPATGAEVLIGSTGLGLNYGQDVSFNRQDGLLYTISCGDQYTYGTYDLATGAFTQIADMGGNQYGTFAITLEPGFVTTYPVTFTVDDGTDPIEGANVNFNMEDVLTNPSGVAVFNVEDATDIPYTVSKTGYSDVTGTQTVAGAAVDVPITMMMVPTYEVTFTIDDGTDPIEGVEIEIDGDVLMTDIDGIATIELENGDYFYSITSTFCDTYTGTVIVLDADASVDVSLTCIPSYEVTFTIDDGTDLLAGIEIEIDGDVLMTDIDGIATIELANGNYDYSITSSFCDTYTGTVTVLDADASVDVSLTCTASYNLTFHVYDADTDVDLEGVTVVITDGPTGWTDVDGNITFTLGEDFVAEYNMTFAGYTPGMGTYTVIEDLTIEFPMNEIVSVNELNSNVNVYPNPSNGQFTISLNGTYTLQVIDITGKVISTQEITNTENINLQESGFYMLRLTNGVETLNYKVIVK